MLSSCYVTRTIHKRDEIDDTFQNTVLLLLFLSLFQHGTISPTSIIIIKKCSSNSA